MTDLENRAREFATRAHGAIDHRRKYTGEPYINHPAAVAELVRSVPHTEEMLAAAWLHDTVEDCGVTPHEIWVQFGDLVSLYVDGLTDVSKPADGNRVKRKSMDLLHTKAQCPAVKTIKLARPDRQQPQHPRARPGLRARVHP